MQFDRMRPDQIAQAVAAGTPVVLPIGVMEYHGAHLPAGVDLLIVTETLKRLGDRIITLPPFAYGAASHAVAGPGTGTLHVEPQAFLPLAEALFTGLLATGFRNLARRDPPPDRGLRPGHAHRPDLPTCRPQRDLPAS